MKGTLVKLMSGKVDFTAAVVPGTFRLLQQVANADVFEASLVAELCPVPIREGMHFTLTEEMVDTKKVREVAKGECVELLVRTEMIDDENNIFAFVYDIFCEGPLANTQ